MATTFSPLWCARIVWSSSPDSRLDPQCDQNAMALSGIRGQVVLPLVSEEVLGTLQVASRQPLDLATLDLRPLKTLAISHRAGLDGSAAARGDPPAESDPGTACHRAGPAPRPRSASRPGSCSRSSTAWATAWSSPTRDGRFLVFNPAAERIVGHGRIDGPPEEWSRQYEIFLARSVDPLSRRGPPPDAGDPRRVGRPGRALHRLSQPR